jgi:hypothetical protein
MPGKVCEPGSPGPAVVLAPGLTAVPGRMACGARGSGPYRGGVGAASLCRMVAAEECRSSAKG